MRTIGALVAMILSTCVVAENVRAADSYAPFIPPRSKDSDSTNLLRYLEGSNLTSDRNLTFYTGDADRALTLSADVSLNQSLLTTSSPTFNGPLIFTNSVDATGWLQLRPSNYGTTYTNQGQAGHWSFSTSYGTQQGVGDGWTGRQDRAFWMGYNLDPTNAGEVAAISGEPGFFTRFEDAWFVANDTTTNNASSNSFTASSMTLSGSDTIVVAASQFTTGSSLIGDYLWFEPSNTQYRISTWTDGSTVKVTGDCRSHSAETITLVSRNMEYHVGPIWPDGTKTRMVACSFLCDRKKILYDLQADRFVWYDGAGNQIFSLDTDINDGLRWEKNRTYLIFDKASGAGTNMIGITASDHIEIGESSSHLAVDIYGNLTLPSGNTTLTSGNLTLTSGNATLTSGSLTLTSGDATLTSGNLSVAGNVTVSATGKGIKIKEGGTAATMGSATLTAGCATVSTTAVTASSRIFLTGNSDGGDPSTGYRVSARVVGTSFTITGSSDTDTGTVAWMLIEPAP